MCNFDGLVRRAESKAGAMQPWPYYFKLRAKEFELLFSFYKPKPGGRALDVGAGIGFTTFILDTFYEKTCATDLSAHDFKTHSLGIGRTRAFLDSVEEKRIDVVSSSCECLPFANGSFDAVYMIYTLEHIRQRVDALREVCRVLAGGGEAIVMVPGFCERVLSPLPYYRDLARTAARHFRKETVQTAAPAGEDGPGVHGGRTLFERMRQVYPHFPFPEPHGDYADFFSELIRSTFPVWHDIIRQSGLSIKDVFTTMLFPKDFSSVLIGDRALDWYIGTVGMTKKYGRNAVLRYCGQNICFILEKNDARPCR
ncbi:MAG: class I SAM-dependent methyltransferase [Candidatus Omnitrophica bacterium]|nr:class I SAM-dependent methyltransferase [Candidatus Omnitrophota bacterium]